MRSPYEFFQSGLTSFQTDDGIVSVAAQAYADLLAKRDEHDRLLELMATDHSEEFCRHTGLTGIPDPATFNIENSVQRTQLTRLLPTDMGKSYSKFSVAGVCG